MNYPEVVRHVKAQPTAMTRRSTVQTAPVLVPDAQETYIIETVWTDEGSYILLQHIDADGNAYRVAIPPKAVQAIYRQHETMVARRRSDAAKRAAGTREARGVVPFRRREKQEAS